MGDKMVLTEEGEVKRCRYKSCAGYKQVNLNVTCQAKGKRVSFLDIEIKKLSQKSHCCIDYKLYLKTRM